MNKHSCDLQSNFLKVVCLRQILIIFLDSIIQTIWSHDSVELIPEMVGQIKKDHELLISVTDSLRNYVRAITHKNKTKKKHISMLYDMQ